MGYTNTIECTKDYTWIDNNDKLSILNFNAQTLFIENMAFNLKNYKFLIVQEDSKFQLPIEIAIAIANKIGAIYQMDQNDQKF